MKRVLSLALAAVLLLGLTACGKKEEEEAVWDGGTIYVPTQVAYTAEMSWLADGCVIGDTAYLLGGDAVKFQNGYTKCDSDKLLRVPLDGGEAKLLPAYQSVVAGEGQRYFTSAQTLRAGADGTLWQVTRGSETFYSLPEGFDEEGLNWGDYQTGRKSYLVLRQLDTDGRELYRYQEDPDILADKVGLSRVTDLMMDNDGEIVVCGEEGVALMTREGEVLFTLSLRDSLDSAVFSPRLLRLGDGQTGVADAWRSQEGYAYYRIQTIDKEAMAWKDAHILGSYSWSVTGPAVEQGVYEGQGDALFYYQWGDEIRAWTAETQAPGEGETVFSWIDLGISSKMILSFQPLGEQRLAVFISTQADESGEYRSWDAADILPEETELCLLEGTDDPRERKIITYASLGMDSNERAAIMRFNRTNPDYQIVVKDYMDYGLGASWEAAAARMATEIAAGQMPDLFAAQNLPVAQWAAAGLLEDLWPWIDRDPDISRKDLMEEVFDALSIGGKLYEVADTFYFYSMMGPRDVVGSRLSWTPEDVLALMKEMPEDCVGITPSGTTLLLDILRLDWGQFVDWEKGTCSFDSPEFQELLEFCARFPEKERADAWWERMPENRQLAVAATPGGFEVIQEYKEGAGGEISFIGYPNPWGKVGSSFQIAGGLCMSSASKNKEGAWAYLRTILLPHEIQDFSSGGTVFPTIRENFEEKAEKAMTTKISNRLGLGSPSGAVLTTKYHQLTQEEYDQIMELYSAIDTAYRPDPNLEEIITEVAGAYFAGDKSAADTAALIQNRANLYVNEQK